MWIFSMFTFLILRHHFYSVGVLMPLHVSYWKILSVTDLYKPARRSPNRGSPEHASLLRSRTVAFLSLSLQFGPTWPAISRPRDSDRPCAVYLYVHKLLQGMFICIISNDIRWLFAMISDVAQYHKCRMCDAVLCFRLYCFRVLLCWLSRTAEAWSLEASWRSLKSRKVLLLQPGLAAENKWLKNRRIRWFPNK